MFQYNDINFYHHGDKSHNSTYRYHLGELSFSDVWYKNIRFAVGLRYELYDYDKFLYQEGNQGFDVGTEHFFSYFAQMHYETFDKAYFPTKGISARASYALYTDNFTKYDDHAPFSAIKGYCQGVIPVTRRFSILPAIVPSVEKFEDSLLLRNWNPNSIVGYINFNLITSDQNTSFDY